ncbi:glycosyltransferase family 2 protein [Parasulfitobacter algicola]|uniref:Glycosyltransferase family 2 protein n=1 Tax=Parasulfitobacter algicola TaxID=2614809 RepID=A0ABX2IWQ5_9RHOB|nr:glycosyltransferase family 2 protein [Sulfitobacter algicola]NSX54894.1 glycosyltransferase family 2 protein [Sulfitobacter algicola]
MRSQVQRVLIVIPCLNEIAHIGGLLTQLLPFAHKTNARIVVADGGSTDGTVETVRTASDIDPRVILMHNPKRLQSAGINLAVARYGDGADVLIRIDAHSRYPDDYCDVLLAEAAKTSATSITVGMIAEGKSGIQAINAAVQNSALGTGGSKHRAHSSGTYVVHGHHALMRIDAFRQVGGYNETFSHNEDAELDWRLIRAGHKIWLTSDTFITYFPRDSFGALARQYFNYGHGRARTMLEHQMTPQLRQLVVIMVMPALMFGFLAPLSLLATVPALVWAMACLIGGIAIAARHRSPKFVMTAVSAAIMHASWSAGFWINLLQGVFRPLKPKTAAQTQ